MGIGKAVVAFMLLIILVTCLSAAILTMTDDRTEDFVYQNDSSYNRTAGLVVGVQSTGLGLGTVLVCISAILVLLGSFMIFRTKK